MIFRTRQSGLSLVELMVTMVISSFLILGVTQVYIDNKRNYAFQQNQSENQENSRYIFLFLQQELAKAGYRRRPDEAMENAFPAITASTAPGCAFAAGQTAVDGGSPTSICIRYQPRDATDRDCLGNGAKFPDKLTKPYTKTTDNFVEKISLDTTKNELTCRSGATSAVLVSGVVDLRFEYGVGSTTDPQTLSSYTTAPLNNQPVLAVRYSVLTRSSGTQLRDSVDIDTALLTWTTMTSTTAEKVTAIKAADKGQLYQVSKNTVMLRNHMP